MNDIFNNYIYDIVEAWIKYRKSRNWSYDKGSYLDWLDKFSSAMERAYEDYIEYEDDGD